MVGSSSRILFFLGHDVSDGGVITCLLEMCFAGLCGMDINIKHRQGKPINILFAEEVGWILEILDGDLAHCLDVFHVRIYITLLLYR